MTYEARQPKYLQAAEAIRTRIVDGTYPSGERIPGEHELAEEFGISRPTLVRALGMLKHDGWLESRQGDGTFSRGPAPSSLKGLAADLGMEPDTLAPLLRKHGFLNL